jgi:protease PrsW
MKALAFALTLLLSLLGCQQSPSERVSGFFDVAGTNDVELSYELPPKEIGDTRALVMQRLAAARIGADVAQDKRTIHIVVDEDFAVVTDQLVTWTGTLLVLDPDPDVVLPPRPELTPAHDEREQWLEGSRNDVLRALEQFAIDREHRVLAEPISTSSPLRFRTRVVKTLPVGELAEGALVGWGSGPTLRIRAAKGTLAASVIHDARERLAPPIVARGRVSLGFPAIEDDGAMTLSFGAGAEGYARAQRERQLLKTPRLPELRRIGSVGLPPNTLLAGACVVVPVLLSLAWLAFVRRFDRAHPEPVWLVATTFVLGAISTAPAALAELTFARVSPWLDPSLVTFGGQAFAFPLALAVFTVVVGGSEEGAKRLAAELAVRRPELDEPVDGIVYGIVASLGFAAAENIRYFAIGRMSAPIVIARCFMSVPAHMFFGALWGYALGAKLVDPRKRTWAWVALAAAAHGLFDTFLSIEGAAAFAILLNLALASAFVVLVRRALRHGVVTKEMLAIPPEERVLIRVGRPATFWFSAAMLHVLALGIFFLGAYWQLARHRPSAVFVIGSSVLVALLAVAALGVAATLPLDVAIDDYGVTFAGAARPWRNIRGYSVGADAIELACDAGSVRLGPAGAAVLRTIASALDARLGPHRTDTLESQR